jgi:hypothetical protein
MEYGSLCPMRKVIDLDEIERREIELVEELKNLRRIKKYALKYGADEQSNQAPNGISAAASRLRDVLETPIATAAFTGTRTAQIDAFEAVREIVGSFPTDKAFTSQDIERALESGESDFSRSAVFAVLLGMKTAGEITITQEGAGRRPTLYVRNPNFKDFEEVKKG